MREDKHSSTGRGREREVGNEIWEWEWGIESGDRMGIENGEWRIENGNGNREWEWE